MEMEMNSNTIVKITIELTDKREVRVQTSTQDKVMLFGLLESAKFAITGEKKSYILTPPIIPTLTPGPH